MDAGHQPGDVAHVGGPRPLRPRPDRMKLLIVTQTLDVNDPILGIFNVNPLHNVVHLLLAAIGFYLGYAATPALARALAKVIGIVYLGLGIQSNQAKLIKAGRFYPDYGWLAGRSAHDAAHERAYGHAMRGRAVEVVNVRLEAVPASTQAASQEVAGIEKILDILAPVNVRKSNRKVEQSFQDFSAWRDQLFYQKQAASGVPQVPERTVRPRSTTKRAY